MESLTEVLTSLLLLPLIVSLGFPEVPQSTIGIASFSPWMMWRAAERLRGCTVGSKVIPLTAAKPQVHLATMCGPDRETGRDLPFVVMQTFRPLKSPQTSLYAASRSAKSASSAMVERANGEGREARKC